jgi:Uma2 family endonuclease
LAIVLPQPNTQTLSRRRWTLEEFERAEQMGVFGPQERLELIGGDIYEEQPVNSPHASGVSGLEEALRSISPSGVYIRTQSPLAAGPDSQPLPDLAVVKGQWRDYTDHHPAFAVLVAEVSDTTLSLDRLTKASLYARTGIPEYWILNLNERLLEVHREPVPATAEPFGHHYRSITRLTETETVEPLFAPNEIIKVSDLLP